MTTPLALNLQHILEGRVLMGVGAQTGASSQFSHVQLWNPAASGSRLVITKLLIRVGVTSGVLARRYTTALTTLSGGGRKKLDLSGSGAAEIRTQTDASALGEVVVGDWTLNANTPITENLENFPLVLLPGTGLNLQASVVNTTLTATFQWMEVAG